MPIYRQFIATRMQYFITSYVSIEKPTYSTCTRATLETYTQQSQLVGEQYCRAAVAVDFGQFCLVASETQAEKAPT